jgi:O-antigen ligase
MVISTLTSKAPFSQNFFGAYGRNNGFLTYSLLSAALIASLLLSKIESFEKVIYGLLTAGIVNILYCAWVLAFGDFMPWSNPYRTILGLLGNPDFASAFLGMFIAASLAYIASKKSSSILRLLLTFASILALYEIIKSHAIQGLVVTAGGIAVVGFYVLRSKVKNQLFTFGYSLFVLIIGVFAVFGTLQKGPLSFVYKRSVSFRGTYWRSGLEMGKSHPLTGVGLDTYGDWYRRVRPPVALVDTPGIHTMSNVSHNVVIDFFASGGYPLLLSYLGIILIGAISILRVTIRKTEYDRVFVAIATAWLGYEVQSFISINQIGLVIWGWVFTGLLVAYEFSTRKSHVTENNVTLRDSKSNNRVKQDFLSPQLVAGVGALIGILIAIPPFNADAKWFNATKSHEAAKVEASLTTNFFSPADSARYAQTIDIFQRSNLQDLAYKYAVIATKFNPDYFDTWKQLYMLSKSSAAEKATALANMKRLDPKNPDVTTN